MIKTIANKSRELLVKILPEEAVTLHLICEEVYNDSYYQPSPKRVFFLDKNGDLIKDISFIEFEQLIYNKLKYSEYSELLWEFDFDGFSPQAEHITIPLEYGHD